MVFNHLQITPKTTKHPSVISSETQRSSEIFHLKKLIFLCIFFSVLGRPVDLTGLTLDQIQAL